MASSKDIVSKSLHCPVVSKVIALSAVRVSLLGAGAELTQKKCSSMENCIVKFGGIDKIPSCLLHQFIR